MSKQLYAVALLDIDEFILTLRLVEATSAIEAMIQEMPALEVCKEESVEFQTELTVYDLQDKASSLSYLIEAIEIPADAALFKKLPLDTETPS